MNNLFGRGRNCRDNYLLVVYSVGRYNVRVDGVLMIYLYTVVELLWKLQRLLPLSRERDDERTYTRGKKLYYVRNYRRSRLRPRYGSVRDI